MSTNNIKTLKQQTFAVTSTDGKANRLTAEIYYNKATTDMFGRSTIRGYYFSLTPKKIERGFESIDLSNPGAKTFLFAVTKRSKSKDELALNMWDHCIDTMMKPWMQSKGYTLQDNSKTNNEQNQVFIYKYSETYARTVSVKAPNKEAADQVLDKLSSYENETESQRFFDHTECEESGFEYQGIGNNETPDYEADDEYER